MKICDDLGRERRGYRKIHTVYSRCLEGLLDIVAVMRLHRSYQMAPAAGAEFGLSCDAY